MNWFSVSGEVLQRQDLNIYEKMCYVFLAKHLQHDGEEITMADLAREMAVEEIVAKGAFHALKVKGIIESDSQVKPGTIIKADQVAVTSPDFKQMSYDERVNRVFEIIDEKINEKEAKIILNFASNDLSRIEEKYKIAKASQFQDKIEVLIHELQKKQAGRIIKKEAVTTEDVQPFEPIEDTNTAELAADVEVQRQTTQVNTYRINQMKKYKKK